MLEKIVIRSQAGLDPRLSEVGQMMRNRGRESSTSSRIDVFRLVS